MSGVLTGKVALVTGGGRGIGRAIVQALAQAGATVAFTYAGSKDAADALAAELAAAGHTAQAIQADARDGARAQEVADAVAGQYGRLDILVNNAGITRDNLLLRMTEEQWAEVMDSNLKSVFNYTKAASKPMMRQRSGSMVNIGSVVGLGGNAGQSNYAASKAGMIGFTKSIAKELASRNIRANVVAPGFIQTDMTAGLAHGNLDEWLKNIPLKRAGSPDDVAQAVVFLASDQSAYITGQVLSVDGGMAM